MEKIRIKGFDKNLQYRGMQFEVGKEYKINSTELELCADKVFLYCKSLKQVAEYYNVGGENRFCYIEVLGDEICDNEKCGSNHIKIGKEIVGAELDLMLGKINGNSGNFNSGNDNSGDCNTGDNNTGDGNTGDNNTGDGNTGDNNTGYRNTGNGNTGYWNTGNNNTGNNNTGNWNSCNYSSGFFCSKEPKAVIFNIETDMTVTEFRRSKYYHALISVPFILIEDKKDELLTRSYKEACAKWWAKMTPENKEIIKSMPNFNAEVFKEITGITIRNKKEI